MQLVPVSVISWTQLAIEVCNWKSHVIFPTCWRHTELNGVLTVCSMPQLGAISPLALPVRKCHRLSSLIWWNEILNICVIFQMFRCDCGMKLATNNWLISFHILALMPDPNQLHVLIYDDVSKLFLSCMQRLTISSLLISSPVVRMCRSFDASSASSSASLWPTRLQCHQIYISFRIVDIRDTLSNHDITECMTIAFRSQLHPYSIYHFGSKLKEQFRRLLIIHDA